MLSFVSVISSIFAIVLIFQMLETGILRAIETIKNARDSF